MEVIDQLLISKYTTPCLVSTICVGASVLAWTVSIIQKTFIDIQTRDGATVAWMTFTHEGSRSVVTQLVTASVVEVTLVYVQTRVSILRQHVARVTVARVLTAGTCVAELSARTHVSLVTPGPGGVSDLG